MSMEMIVKTDLEKEIPQKIESNYAEVKEWLSGKLQKYNSMVVTEDSIKEANKDVTALNKLAKALNDKKIQVKKACLKPFEEIETQFKDLISMIDEAKDSVKDQTKALEDIKMKEKYGAIERFYRDNIDDLIDLVPMKAVLTSKWQNKTMSAFDVTQDMIDKIMEIRQNLKTIEGMKLGEDRELEFKNIYLNNLDFSKTMAIYNEQEEQKKKIQNIKQKNVPEKKPDAPKQTLEKRSTKSGGKDELETFAALFIDMPKEFKKEMNALIKKYGVKCRRLTEWQ